MTSSHSCAQIAWIFLHIVYRVENIRLKHYYWYAQPLCVALDYLTVCRTVARIHNKIFYLERELAVAVKHLYELCHEH